MGTYTLIKQLSYNCTAKRCPGQGLYVFKQFRMLGLRHNDSCSPGESARPHGLRPWWCTRLPRRRRPTATTCHLRLHQRRAIQYNYNFETTLYGITKVKGGTFKDSQSIRT